MMKSVPMPRLLLAAPKSGSGKTLITCGLLELLKRKGQRPASCKCGPDYIDPMFHRYVLGVPGANLDSFFLAPEEVRRTLLAAASAEKSGLTLVEGVMGYYDGMGGTSDWASAYEIASITETPTVLVIDARGASLSLIPLIKGFLSFRSESQIRGIVLNRVSAGLYERLKLLIETECQVSVFGYLPENPEYQFESRHLGLFLPEETKDLRRRIGCLADQLEHSLDWPGLVRLAQSAPPLEAQIQEQPEKGTAVRIGVARDEAFCFYYQENLELLKRLGAELIAFSPLHDKTLPKGLGGILLGGGYPENHGAALEANETMRRQVQEALHQGLPVLAECGGFLYLHRTLEGSDGRPYQMAGALSANAYRTKRLGRFGYVELTSRDGQTMRGHEFHYWESSEPGEDWLAKKPVGGQSWRCIHENEGQILGFPHLYYPSNPAFLKDWLLRCSVYQERKKR